MIVATKRIYSCQTSIRMVPFLLWVNLSVSSNKLTIFQMSLINCKLQLTLNCRSQYKNKWGHVDEKEMIFLIIIRVY